MEAIFTVPVPRTAFSVDEAAASLGLSRVTIYELMKTGALRAVKVGRRTLVTAAEIDRFLAASAVGAIGK